MIARERWRIALRWLLALVYCIAGVLHVTHPAPFVNIVPDWVPMPYQVVIATGVCEISGAIGLVVPRLRRIAGIMLALYAVCVFPANVKHAIHDLTVGGPGALGWAYHGLRLPFQLVIVWWCLFAGGVIDWPFWRSHSKTRLPDRNGDRGG